ncbi:MAG: hypothetical protein JWM33_494, partial [Caulobacteraceae bacterium]|nr:hypothetical protein [Caulobacteraceae bacterium]
MRLSLLPALAAFSLAACANEHPMPWAQGYGPAAPLPGPVH